MVWKLTNEPLATGREAASDSPAKTQSRLVQ
jgi:hypothetical protein